MREFKLETGGFCPRGIWSYGGFSPGRLYPVGFYPGGFYPGGFSPRPAKMGCHSILWHQFWVVRGRIPVSGIHCPNSATVFSY